MRVTNKFYLRVRTKGKHKNKSDLGLYYPKSDRIAILLYNFKNKRRLEKPYPLWKLRKTTPRFIKILCDTINHEYVHHFLRGFKIEDKKEEDICEFMEAKWRDSGRRKGC